MALSWTGSGDPMKGAPSYASNEGHRLEKVGKNFVLTHPDGHKDNLGKRATFDHAEGAIAKRQGAARGVHPGAVTQHPNHTHDGPKHTEHALQHGPKGGTFYVGEGGKKEYGNK